jgi:hypothetical protein
MIENTFDEGRVLLVNKPLHWTSFDVIRKIRNTIKIKKVGHAGTLDPLATGLLIVCTGKFTKQINEYMAQERRNTPARLHWVLLRPLLTWKVNRKIFVLLAALLQKLFLKQQNNLKAR